MALFCTHLRYTDEALIGIIKNKEDRSVMARKAIESAGGTYHGMYGMLGQDHHVMVIADMPSITEHLAVVMMVMGGGSVEDVKTITLYEGADVVAAATMAAGGSVDYSPVS